MSKKFVLAALLGTTLLSTGAFAEDKPTTDAVQPAPTAEAATAAVPVNAEVAKPASAPEAPDAAKVAPVVADVTKPATPEPVSDEVIKTLTEKLKPLFGDSAPDSIKATVVPGVFAATFGMELIYVSQDGRYFFSGDLIDGQTRTNLSEHARASGRKAVMDKADMSKTITYKAKGDEKYAISVFTDVSCPYCVKLHHEVPKLNDMGVTVHYFAYPRAGVGSGAYKEMVSAWCSPDPVKALNESKDGKTIEVKDCTNPVADHYALGQKVGVTGTPAIVTQDGVMIAGFRPAQDMFDALEESKRPQ